MKNPKNNQVTNCFKEELVNLILLAGLNPNDSEDLRCFAHLGGSSAKDGISGEKINWVLKDGLIPREDFLYCLAKIAIEIKNRSLYYTKQGILNPKRYELERFLLMCGYVPQIGNVFPVSEKFRRPKIRYTEVYAAAIPNIFWDVSIPYVDALTIFDSHIPRNGLKINISESIDLSLTRLNYEYVNGAFQLVELHGEEQSAEAISFKLVNTEREMRFSTIEAVRQINSSLIPITLINGNWIDLVSSYCDWADGLSITSHYNYLDLYDLDSFFKIIPGYKRTHNMFGISELNKFLMQNEIYQDTYKRLTLTKDPTEE